MLLTYFNRTLSSVCFCCCLALVSGCTDQASQQQEKAAIHFKSANSYHEQGQFRAALSEYKSALDKAPTTEYAIALSRVFLELNQTQAAINLLEPLNVAYPKETSQILAEAYVQKGKFNSALKNLSPSNGLDSEDINRAQLLIRSYLGLGQYKKAATTLQDYRKLFGADANAELLTLELALKTNDTALQKATMLTLQQTFNNAPRVNLTLGIIALNANQLDQAEKHLTAALSALPQTDIMTPEKLQVLTNLSDTLTRRGRFTEAMLYSQLISEAHPDIQSSQKDLNEAVNQIRLGNFDEAEGLLITLAENHPASDRINALLGVVQLQQGNINEAGLRLADSVDPELASPQLVKAAAQAQLKLAKPQQAVELLREALKKNPDNAQLLTLFGLSSSYVPGLETESELALQKAVAMQPANPRLYLALAQLYSRQGKSELSLSQLKLAARQDPTDPAIASSYVQALLMGGDKKAAERFLEQLKIDQPNNANPWQLSAAIAQYDNNPALAHKHLTKALELDPHNVTTLIAKGRLAQQQKNFKQAQSLYQQAIKLSPEQPSAATLLIATSIKLKNTDKILAQLEKLASANNQSAISAIGQYNLSLGNLDDANLRAKQLASLPDNLTKYSRLSGTKIQRAVARQKIAAKDYSGAIAELQLAIKFSPANLQILADIAQAQLLNGEQDSAQNTIAQLRQRQGGRSPADMLEALALEQDNPDKAMALLRKSIDEQKHQETFALLYKMEKKHQPNGVKDTLLLWQESFPNDARPTLKLALEAQQNSEQEAAIKLYQSVLEKAPNQVIALNNLAWLYSESEKFEDAITTAERAAELAPNSADVIDTLGWIYHLANDDRAYSTLSKAAELAPENAEIKKHLDTVKARL